ncbi:MAG: DedA family protein [Ktedonobacteraceae bacterium]|nr:DedA family protein [Ktedonobacteraceae bacterium]
MISLQILQDMLNTVGYPAVVLFIFIESTGIPFPGETMLLLASFYAATSGHLSLPGVIACAALGAILGDNLGYYIGRVGGRRFIERFGRYLFLKTEHLDKAEAFFNKHGAKTVFFARFVTLLRIWAAFLAGVNRMNWRTFMFYNAAGGIAWAVLVGTLGYIAGNYFQNHFDQVLHVAHVLGWTGLGVVVLTGIAAIMFFKLRRKHTQPVSEEKEQEETPESVEATLTMPR